MRALRGWGLARQDAAPGPSRPWACLGSRPTSGSVSRYMPAAMPKTRSMTSARTTTAGTMDALPLYVNAYTLEISLVDEQVTGDENGWVVSRAELLRRFAALPGTFPLTKRHAAELTAGTGHDRFDFTIGLMLDGLARRQEQARPPPGTS